MTPEQIAAMQEQLKEAQDGIAAVTAKNQELLGENKRFKAKAKGADIDPEEHADLKHQLESVQADFAKLQKSSAKEVETLQGKLKGKDSALQGHILDGSLSTALAGAGVQPEMQPAVQALLKGRASLAEDGDSYSPMMGDVALADGVAEWAKSDEAKPFIAALANSGGGASGGGKGNGGNSGPATAGSLTGNKADRAAAIASRFPELSEQ